MKIGTTDMVHLIINSSPVNFIGKILASISCAMTNVEANRRW